MYIHTCKNSAYLLGHVKAEVHGNFSTCRWQACANWWYFKLAIDSEGDLENLLGGVNAPIKGPLLGSELQVCLSIFQNLSIMTSEVPSINVSAIDLLPVSSLLLVY